MKINLKSEDAYKTIGEVAKELGLIDKKSGHLQTHTLRYWETQFKQIKPLIKAGKRRYYSKKNFQIIKLIKFLLKEKGLTINGVKKILNNPETSNLDDNTNLGIYKPDLIFTNSIKNKINRIYKIIKELKKTGIDEVTLYFEFSFREREPFDSNSIKDIKESVNYWRKYLD